jgi:hypothetical protein
MAAAGIPETGLPFAPPKHGCRWDSHATIHPTAAIDPVVAEAISGS